MWLAVFVYVIVVVVVVVLVVVVLVVVALLLPTRRRWGPGLRLVVVTDIVDVSVGLVDVRLYFDVLD